MEAGPSTVAQSWTEGNQVVGKNIYRYLIINISNYNITLAFK